MSFFSAIKDKIFAAGEALLNKEISGGSPAPAPAPTEAAPAPATTSTTDATAAPPSTPAQPVDVGATLSDLAAKKGGGGNYRTSIVDLLKLLDLDSSLDARKGLANELDVHVGADGTAEENIALHKAVMAKLAENGGQVPDDMR